MITTSMVPVPQYNQSMQPNTPTPQAMYSNNVYAQGQGQEQQNQNYGGRGYGGSGGRGMGGRPLNVDARPFNSYQGGHSQGQVRDYYNGGGYNQGQGHGHQMSYEQQGSNMGNQNVYNNENHAYSQQQVYMPHSTSNRMQAGNNGHNIGRGESYPAAQGIILRGGDGEPLGVDGRNHVGVAESDSSNQLKTSDSSTSS